MSKLDLVHVDLAERSYDIFIGENALDEFESQTSRLFKNGSLFPNHAVVIADQTVSELYYSDRIQPRLEQTFHRVDLVELPPGEATKSVSHAESVWKKLVELNTDRKSTVIALGGGVAGDLAGFVASTFARGIRFIQIPTTLLSQVDSSVGGKVGINLPGAKNMVGAFAQPTLVVIDTTLLATLSEREFRSGLAEVVKYGVILDEPFFVFLESNPDAIMAREQELLREVIKRSCQLKAQIVKEDETEVSGRRAVLNYGHTFGHAIEAVFGYGTFTHGEAIAIGMNCAARLATTMSLAGDEVLSRQSSLFEKFELPLVCPRARHEELLEAMFRDKKVSQGVLHLVLPTKIGHVDLYPAPSKELLLSCLANTK